MIDEGKIRNVLVRSVVQEDEGNDSVGGIFIIALSKEGRADGLEDKENKHAAEGGQEENTTANLVNQEGCSKGPTQVPDLENTVDEELDGGIGDTNGIKDTIEIVRYKAISGPLREEGEGDNDPQTLQVASLGNERLPANVGSDGAIKFNGRLDFLKLVLDERILARIYIISHISDPQRCNSRVAVSVVVGENLESFGIPALADQPTRRLRDEVNQDHLEDRGEALEEGGNTPSPGRAGNLESTESCPCGARKLLLDPYRTRKWHLNLHDSARIPERVIGRRERCTISGI